MPYRRFSKLRQVQKRSSLVLCMKSDNTPMPFAVAYNPAGGSTGKGKLKSGRNFVLLRQHLVLATGLEYTILWCA